VELKLFNPMPDFEQSIEMMKNMWSKASSGHAENGMPNFGIPGISNLNPFGIPTIDIEELDKRIKDLKSVEAWLTLNLNVLQTTVQGLEVQRATLATLQGIAETMKSNTAANPSEQSKAKASESFAQAAEFAGTSGKLAQELMEQMAKSTTDMMQGFQQATNSTAAKNSPAKPRARKTAAKPSAKTARSPRSR
jgi:uncharacterized membrane-anchored protein YhcB (DUF1043 family)